MEIKEAKHCIIRGDTLYGILYVPDKNGILVIPNGIKTIKKEAIAKNKDIKTVVLPDSLEVIGYAAFADCVNLASINIPKSVKEVHNEAFSRCTSLKEVSFWSTTGFGKNCFRECAALSKLILNDKSVAKVFYFPVYNQFLISVPIKHQISKDITIYEGHFTGEGFPVEIRQSVKTYVAASIKDGKEVFWYDSSMRRAVDGCVVILKEANSLEILGVDVITEDTIITPDQFSLITGICSAGVDWWLQEVGYTRDTKFKMGELLELLQKTTRQGYNRLIIALSQANKYSNLLAAENGAAIDDKGV